MRVLFLFDRVVLGMALLRFLSSSIEFSAAMLMLYFNRVETAFKINSLLALVGPTVLLTTTSLGLVGLAQKVSPSSMAIILLGVILIFIGISRL
ncbi:YqhV family protein [Desulfovirgula thermocuniculi]|uniref:YqhV family protein n=1 Tax=Desulfovirgula thermocuniculi TaxID=348842 RepID=UPI001FDEF2A9|nr:YqhV family protein [Desulfovirgula thermocuniculi]